MAVGLVKFNECCLSELENTDVESDNISLAGSVSMLDQYVGHARESLGVDSHIASSSCSSRFVIGQLGKSYLLSSVTNH